MSISQGLERTLREESLEHSARDIGESAIVTLLAGDRKFVDLSWNTGRQGSQLGRRVPKILELGKSITVPIERAIGYFGPFMIPRDLIAQTDEKKRKEMREHFDKERQRVLLMWGDYPRPRKLADGFEPIGPHRLPHVAIVVVAGDGTEAEPLDLHEVYGVGEYDAEALRPSYFALHNKNPEDELAARNAENAELRGIVSTLNAALHEMKGTVGVLMADRAKPERPAK